MDGLCKRTVVIPMPRIGKHRKEIYLSLTEQLMIKAAQKYTGQDMTNTMRLLMNLGFKQLTGAPYTVGNSADKKM